ncbi:MAG: 50S ribosomal protein L31 [Candidatus Levyibacteriota bacterium]
MKAQIHPTYFEEAQVICACGNRFTVGSTMETIHVELCNNCHPFYTGAQKFVDSASRIKTFQERQEKAKKIQAVTVKKKEVQREKASQPKTLAEMLAAMK